MSTEPKPEVAEVCQGVDLEEPVLVAVLSQNPDVFDLVGYRQQDAHVVARDFPGRPVSWLARDVLSEHARAEVRALLQVPAAREAREGVIIGTTDGKGGWASWKLGFFSPAPGPVPELPGTTGDGQ